MTFRSLGVFSCALAGVLFSGGCATAQGTASHPLPESSPTAISADAQPGEARSDEAAPQDTYTQEETLDAAKKFFGGTSAGLAKAIEKVFSDNGQPVGYIIGEEGSGAVVVGLRYGSGTLKYKNGGSTPVYWQGPSVGFDFGGNASKVFTLVYNLHWTRDIFQKFPGVDGSLYIVAGVGLNYLRASDITLAPIRTGVGLRAGASVGYLTFTREKSYNPF
jgi:hypothetical protein